VKILFFAFFFVSKILLYYFLVARVGRKRGKMNLEKTINKNMFDMSSSIRDTNPLQTPDIIKNDQHDTSSIPLSSILSHPKQKLTAQFKRAITMIKQRSEPTHESSSSSSPQLLTSLSLTEKPNYSLDSTLLTSLVEETNHDDLIPSADISSSKSQSFIHVKPSIKDKDKSITTATTVINLDPITRMNHQNQSLSTHIVNSSLQQIQQPSIVQTTNQQTLTPQISSSSATLSPTPSSSTTTTTSGEFTILVTNL